MKFNIVLNEIYTRDRYSNYKGGNYFTDGIDLHVEDTEANYPITFSKTDRGLLVNMIGTRERRTPKGFDIRKPQIPYEIKQEKIIDKNFSPKEFYDYCKNDKIYRVFLDYIIKTADKNGCNFDELNYLERLTKSIYFNLNKTFDFKVLEDEINGLVVRVNEPWKNGDDNFVIIYNTTYTPEIIDQRQKQAKERKMLNPGNIGWKPSLT